MSNPWLTIGRLVSFITTAALVVALSDLPCHAVTKLWTGNSTGNFNNSGNWSPAGVPAAGDDLIFQPNNLVARLLVTNDFSPNRAFRSIAIQGTNYFIRGNPLLLTNGITAVNVSGVNTIDADVEVRGPQIWEGTGSLGLLDVNGDINLGTNTLTVRANTADFTFSGIISGSGNLVKTNVGTLRLDGCGHNTYTGFTRLDGGVLDLNKTCLISLSPPVVSNYVAIPGDLTIGDGNGSVGTDVLRLFANDQIANTSDVTVKNSGIFNLNDRDDRIGALTMQGGTINTGTGTLILGGDVTTLDDVNQATINGQLSLGGATRTFNLQSGTASPDLVINASISPGTSVFASAGIIKNNYGMLSLTGTNTYNGTTTINQGPVLIYTDRALGTTNTPLGLSAGTVINTNGFLWLIGVQVTNEDLTLNNVYSFAIQANNNCVWTGDILLNGDASLSSGDTFLLSGQITGTGGMTIVNFADRSVTLGGATANTYTGTTRVLGGTLLLDKAVVDGAMAGPLVIGEDELPANTNVVRYLRSNQLPNNTQITINTSGLLDLNGFSDSVGDLIFNGGDVDAPSPGTILPTGDITVNANTNSVAVISGRLSVATSPIIDVTGHYFSPDLRVDAQVIGAGGLTKSGPGEISLSSSNTYTGVTTIREGAVDIDDSFALGSTNQGTILNSGARLALRFGSHVGAEPLNLAGMGIGSGSLRSLFGSNSWDGNITLSSNAMIYVNSASDYLNLRGAISGNFDITKSGAGTLIYSGGAANTYGDTTVEAGTLELAKNVGNGSIPGNLQIGDGTGGIGADIVRIASGVVSQIGNTGVITIATSGLLDVNTVGEIVNGVQGNGRIDLGTGVLNVAIETDFTYRGLIFGAGELQKSGNGNWTLNANNTYTGHTTVSGDGALIVNGFQPQSDVFLLDDANLGGSGVVGSIDSLGVVGPGTYLPGPAILTCSNVFFHPAEYFEVDLAGPSPGTGYDQLNVRGTNNITGANLLVRVAPGFAPNEGQQFTILNNDGAEAIVGTFSGLPNNSIFTVSGLKFHIRYSDTFGNDIVLTVTNVATHLVSVAVDGGNGNGAIDPNECNLLNVVITNTAGNVLSNLTATLVPRTPGVSVTYGTSAYPTMAVNARGTNVTPFQFTTSPGFICGTNIQFDLVVTTLTNGLFTMPISIPSGFPGTPVPYSLTGDQLIPDGGTLNSTMGVGGITSSIVNVTVSLYLTHPADQEVHISLIGPDGTMVDLSSDNGGTLDDYGNSCAQRTAFSDAASTAITSGTPPFIGTFRPEQALSNFVGKAGAAANGTWTLRISDDNAVGNPGMLHCWTLNLAQAACLNGSGLCESCPEDRTIRGILGDVSLVQSNRLYRDTEVHFCGETRFCPGLFGTTSPRHYDAWTFENGESNACITVTLTSDADVMSAAYSNSYNPADLCQNYISDAGNSTGAIVQNGTVTYGFNVAARARFVVVVNSAETGDDGPYTLAVTGGSCRPALKIDSLGANRVALDWSTAAIGYNLFQTNRLPVPLNPNWIPSTSVPVMFNGRYRITNATSPSTTFYELRKP